MGRSHAHSLHIVYDHFCTPTAELSSCDKDHMGHNARNTYYLFLYQKSLLFPTPEYEIVFLLPAFSVSTNCKIQGQYLCFKSKTFVVALATEKKKKKSPYLLNEMVLLWNSTIENTQYKATTAPVLHNFGR